MMKLITSFLLLILFNVSTYAQEKNSFFSKVTFESSEKYLVKEKSTHITIHSLHNKQLKLNNDKQYRKIAELPYQAYSSTLPTLEYRDLLFKECNLDEHIKEYDHLEKDILFLRAKNYSLERLIRHYQHIPTEKLMKLKNELTDE